MEIYIICLLIIILLYILLFKIIKTKYSREIFCIAVFVMFSLIQGLRSYQVGSDTKNYVKFYGLVKNMSIKEVLLQSDWVIEPGYGMLMKLCSLIGLNTRFFIIIVAVIINGGLMYFIYKNSDNPFISVIIFMGVEFFTLSFTALRQMLAVIIILNSYTFIKKKNIIKFFFTVLLAAIFHKSALVFLPVYFLKDLKIDKKNLIIGCVILLLFQLCGLPLMEFFVEKFYYPGYLQADGSGLTQTFVILIYFVLGVIIYEKYKNKEKNNDNVLFIIIYISLLFQSLSYKISMVNRIIWYFYIFIIIFLPNIINLVKKEIMIKKKIFSLKDIIYLIIIILNIIQYIFFSIRMYNIIPYSFL